MGKTKTKVTLSRFVQVMSGGMVVMTDGSSGPRAKAFAAKQRIEALLASLVQEGAPCREIQALIDTYEQGVQAALQQPGRQQEQMFAELEVATVAAEVTAQGHVNRYLPLAQRLRAQKDALHQRLQRVGAQVSGVARANVKAALQARLQALAARLQPASQLADATELDAGLASLARLQADLDGAEFDRYVDVAAQLDQRLSDTAALIDRRLAQAGGLPKSALRSVLEGQLDAFKKRLPPLNQVQDLLRLVDQNQAAGDLAEEVGRIDIAAAARLGQQYEDLAATLLMDFNTRQAEVDAQPAPALKALLDAQLKALQARLLPLDRATSIATLADMLAGLRALQGELADFKPAEHAARAQQYAALLTKARAAHDDKVREAAALPDALTRKPLETMLAGLLALCKPLDQLADLAALEVELADMPRLVARLEVFDISRYVRLAEDFRAHAAEALLAFNEKAAEIATLPASPARTLLEARLDEHKAELKPLDQAADLADLDTLVSALPGLIQRTRGIDVAGIGAKLQEHTQLLQDLPGEIAARVAVIGASLSAGELAALTAEFSKRVDAERTYKTLGDLSSKIAQLKHVRTDLAARQIKPHSDVQQKRLKRADATLGSARGAVAKLPPGPLRQASSDALDWLETSLNQLKVGAPAQGLPEKAAAGYANKSGFGEVKLADTERTRALDAAIKTLEAALKNPAGDDAKLLEMEGGSAVAYGLCRVNIGLVAFGASHKGISGVEALAVRCYTGADYSAMNRERRGLEKNDRLALLNKICDKALEKMPPYPEAGWPSFRAERAWSQDVVDKRYGLSRQFSCGVLWSTGARGVADIPGRGIPTLTHVIFGKSGRDVAALSANPHEGSTKDQYNDGELNLMAGRGEVLFPATANFIVSGRIDPPNAPESLKFNADSGDYAPRIKTTLKEVRND